MAKISMKVGNTNETANRTMKGIRREKTKVRKFNTSQNLDRMYEDLQRLTSYEKEVFTLEAGYQPITSVDDLDDVLSSAIADIDIENDEETYKSKTRKSKVKKGAPTGWVEIANEIDSLVSEIDRRYVEFWDSVKDPYFFDDEESSMYANIDDGLIEVRDALKKYNNILDRLFSTVKAKKSMTTKDMVKALNACGYTVHKGDEEVTEETVVEEPIEETVEEETADEEEASEDEESEEVEDADVEVDVDVEKNMTLKSAINVLKQRGWIKGIQKEDGAGMKADDVKQFVQNQSKKNPVPADDVGDAKTGIPKDVPESEGEENDDLTDDEGGSIEALLNPEGKNIDISQFGLEDDDLDVQEAIDKRRMQKDSEARGLPTMMASQPYANNYRTTQQGEGKVDVRTMLNATPKTNKTWRV